jgi:hypothetical protein
LRGRDEVTCKTVETTRAALPDVPEASGLAVSRRTPGILWTLNDGRGEPAVTAIDTTGAVKGRVLITGAKKRDWEAVAVAPCGKGASCLYVGDTGDNDSKHPDISIYRVSEPLPGDKATTAAAVFTGRFPDQPHDTEAMFIAPDGGIFLITKERPAGVFRFPAGVRPGTVVMLQQVGFIPTEKVTDAATSPDGRFVAMRTGDVVMFYRTDDIAGGEVDHGSSVSLMSMAEPQGEGVAIAPDGTVYLAGEGAKPKAPGTLAALSCSFPGEPAKRKKAE